MLLGELSGSEFGHFASILWSGLDLRSDCFLQKNSLTSGVWRVPGCLQDPTLHWGSVVSIVQNVYSMYFNILDIKIFGMITLAVL